MEMQVLARACERACQPQQRIARLAMEKEPAVFGLFWDSLVEAGTLDAGLIFELKKSWNPGVWRPLGEVLIRRKILTLKQVAGLISLQVDEPNIRIGDLAIREGYCTPQQLEEALDAQREACPGPIEILMRDGSAKPDDLLTTLMIYVRFLEGRILGEDNRGESIARAKQITQPAE